MVGAFGGKLTKWSATELCSAASKAAIASAGVDPKCIDSVFVGNVAQTSIDAAYIARHVQLKCDIPMEKTALTVNRLCGSGFQSVINGVEDIMLRNGEISLCGGSENMSQAPLSVFGQNARFGTALGKGLNMEDTLWAALTDNYTKTPMGVTAENLAEKYGISRRDCDEYAMRSQETWATAKDNGVFKEEMATLTVKGKKGSEEMDTDEHPRKVAMEKLAKLPTVFKKDGVVTAANASGICDGAGSVLVASEDAVKQHGLKPLARIVSYGIAGVDPSIMGIGPVPAIQQALKRAGLTLQDMDRIEINEAFAAQYIACEKELDIDRSITNTNGGAISLGHPLGASGSRIVAHLAHDLIRLNKKYAVVRSSCLYHNINYFFRVLHALAVDKVSPLYWKIWHKKLFFIF